MSLTRGSTSLFPYVVCLVPAEELRKIWKEYEKRTAARAKQILDEARSQRRVQDHDEILKSWGLRGVEV